MIIGIDTSHVMERTSLHLIIQIHELLQTTIIEIVVVVARDIVRSVSQTKLRRLEPRVVTYCFRIIVTERSAFDCIPGAIGHTAGVSVVRAAIRSTHRRCSAGDIVAKVRGRAERIGHALQFAGDRVAIADRVLTVATRSVTLQRIDVPLFRSQPRKLVVIVRRVVLRRAIDQVIH